MDRYVLRQTAGTFVSVFAIVLSLMIVEHFPRLLGIVSHSGNKAFVVFQSILALLPEYTGVGLLFGLYLSVALTIRRLSLRCELDVVQATGMPVSRLMRIPALLAVGVAGMMLWTQGWLMPAGEARLSELSRRLQDGQFGMDLEAGKFIDLGKGTTLRFADVDPETHTLRNVFLSTPERTITASRGRLGFAFTNDVLVDLTDGRALEVGNDRSLSFSRFQFDSRQRRADHSVQPSGDERRKRTILPRLLSSRDHVDSAAGWSRLLWPSFALLIPFLATVLGKPMRRSSSSLGAMLGVVLLVMFIRSAEFVAASGSSHPEVVAMLTCGGWAVVIWGFVLGERRWGAGYIDRALLNAVRRAKFARLSPVPPSTASRWRGAA
jgi:lipopolysaccharide export LptBFGC system permease protein LptF